ncbi:MAG: SRPBCC domain-containing protein [Devosia nanyangense]|uniref:SRPBCC domain-containing protein n=1 Tax=Devosia nanyangense TaxID=1228055 RepID=A0A933NX33_9HYPH|nr:SRPBCC domain-containing protein [Devosia nanyangense]
MEKQIVDIETMIAADAARVWLALTGPGATVMPMTKVETDWIVGHPIVFSGEWQGKAFEDHGEIRKVVERKEVIFTHWSGNRPQPDDYHVVRYALSPEGGSTKVRLTQSNIGPKAEVDEKTKSEFARTFGLMLDNLKVSAEGK